MRVRAVTLVPIVLLAGLLSTEGALATASGTTTTTATTIVLERSIAGVGLGELRAVVEKRLGPGVFVSGHLEGSGGEPRLRVETRSYAGLLITYVRLRGTPARQGRVEMLDTRSPRYRTVAGLGVGSGWTAVLSLKGAVGSLGACTAWMTQCQHGGNPANGGRMTVFFQADRRISRIVITFGH